MLGICHVAAACLRASSRCLVLPAELDGARKRSTLEETAYTMLISKQHLAKHLLMLGMTA